MAPVLRPRRAREADRNRVKEEEERQGSGGSSSSRAMPPKKKGRKEAKRPAAAPESGSEDEEDPPTWEVLRTFCRLEARLSALERDVEWRRAGAQVAAPDGPSLPRPIKEEAEEGARPAQPAGRPGGSAGEGGRPGGAAEGGLACAPRALQERTGGAPVTSARAPGPPPPPPFHGVMGPPGGFPGAPHGGDPQRPPTPEQKPRPAASCAAPGPSGLAQPPLSSGDVELRLGDHLAPATRQKILRGEFVDLFGLLNREREGREEDEEEKRRVERTWDHWLPAFLIYASVLVEARPWQALGLIHYLDLIHRVYVGYQGPAWLHYDEAFRHHVAAHPSVPWGDIHPTLWLWYVQPAVPYEGVRTDSGHLLRRPVPDEDRAFEGWPDSGSSRGLCWQFARQGTCRWHPCRFEHRCSVCGEEGHSVIVCPQGERAKPWRGRRKKRKGPRREETPEGPYSG